MADLKEQHDYDSQPPRPHHYLFVHRFLRDRVLTGPLDFFQKLQEDSGIAYLETHWALVGIQAGDSSGDTFVPPDGLEIFPMVMWNGCSVIIIQLPKPERMTEAYFAGIALWEDRGLRRYFTLELTEDELGSTPGGVLCEWRQDEHINYQIVIAPDKDGFFDAVRQIVMVEQSRDLMEEYCKSVDSEDITFYDSLPEYTQAVSARCGYTASTVLAWRGQAKPVGGLRQKRNSTSSSSKIRGSSLFRFRNWPKQTVGSAYILIARP